MITDIPQSEIVLIDPAKLSAAADVLYNEHGYEAYDPSLLTLALYEWVAEEVERLVNNAVKIVTATEHGMEWARFDGWVRYLAERRGVEVVT